MVSTKEDGTFVSPGAWGTTWEDLVELKHDNVALWHTLAEMFLTWCRRGVDGFRCDAGYKVPLKALANTSLQRFSSNFLTRFFCSKAWAAHGSPPKPCSMRVECNGPIESCSKTIMERRALTMSNQFQASQRTGCSVITARLTTTSASPCVAKRGHSPGIL